MLKVGLKLWSTNIALAEHVRQAFSRGEIDFLELYVVPGTVPGCGAYWHGLGGPVVLHAPHFGHGFNLADPLLRSENRNFFYESQMFADRLKSSHIVVHGGNGGCLEEAIDQLRGLNEPRVALENKPLRGINGKECIGYSVAQIRQIMRCCNLNKFILDLNHAVHAARSLQAEPLEFLGTFFGLNPIGYHLADGDPGSETDAHMDLGQGQMPLLKMVSLLEDGAAVTLETPLNIENGIGDFLRNRAVLINLIKKGCRYE